MADDRNDDETRTARRRVPRHAARSSSRATRSIDPSQLAGAAGLPNDPGQHRRQLIGQLQNALQQHRRRHQLGHRRASRPAQLAAADAPRRHRRPSAPPSTRPSTSPRSGSTRSTSVAELTAHAPSSSAAPSGHGRPCRVWTQLAEPVALSIADALTRVLAEQAPEEMQGMLANAGQMMRSIGGALFAMQLGQVVGQLASEVVSGGDIGIPLLDGRRRPRSSRRTSPAFGEGLDIPDDQVQLYLAVRELAHARLFRHAKWLRLHLITSITEFAQGITHRHRRGSRSWPRASTRRTPRSCATPWSSGRAHPAEDRGAAGRARPARDDARARRGLGRRRHRRAPRACCRRPTRSPRRCAAAAPSGGPAESAFATLVGLELRPRRLREAAAMWQAVTDAVGAEARDALWSHPDLLPTVGRPRRPVGARRPAHRRGDRPGAGARRRSTRRSKTCCATTRRPARPRRDVRRPGAVD